jgi:signal transduction histidine kinase
LFSALVYTAAGVGGFFLFKNGLTGIIDDEIDALVSEIMPAIEVTEKGPSLLKWAETSKTVPFKFLPTIQLFDKGKQMIEQHGPSGFPQLYPEDVHEIHSADDAHPPVRIFSTPLQLPGDTKTEGYLQIQLSLRSVDRATNAFASTLTMIAPFLLLGLGIVGYIYSGLAAKPIEVNFELLRRFMNDAGHELSTPISIVQANAEAMELDLQPEAAAMTKLSIINRSTDRMGKLVQDLMLLSKMESPQVHTRRSIVQLDQLVEHVLEEFDELFRNKNIDLKRGKFQPLSITVDADQIKRLVTNLLQNALRYTDEGGTVETTVDTFGRYARIVISDTGIGIPSESVSKIFDRFYRVDKARTRAAGGVGLGLSIVRAVVEAHKGKIEVTSQEGKGTKFSVFLPR